MNKMVEASLPTQYVGSFELIKSTLKNKGGGACFLHSIHYFGGERATTDDRHKWEKGVNLTGQTLASSSSNAHQPWSEK
jgi:hypothetical protein